MNGGNVVAVFCLSNNTLHCFFNGKIIFNTIFPVAKENEDKVPFVKEAEAKNITEKTNDIFFLEKIRNIIRMEEKLKANKNDNHSRRGLMKMVGRRKGLLDYLKSKDIEAYRALIAKLGLRK